RAWRTRTKFAIFRASHAHHPQKRPQRHHGREERVGGFAFKLPVKEKRRAKALFEKAKALYHAGPTPSAMARREHFDLKRVTRLRVFHPDGSGKCVDTRTVDREIFADRHARLHLPAACIDTCDQHFIAGFDAKARLERPIPDRVSRFGRERVFSHDSFTRTLIWISTRAPRGSALTPMAARTCWPASPKTCTRRSDAPLMTSGELSKPAAAFT